MSKTKIAAISFGVGVLASVLDLIPVVPVI